MGAEVKRGWTIEEHGKWVVLVLHGRVYDRRLSVDFTRDWRDTWQMQMRLGGEPELIMKKGEVALLPAEQRKCIWD